MSLAEQPYKTRLFPSPCPSKSISTPLSILDATVARFSATGAIWFFDAPSHRTSSREVLVDRLRSSFVTTLNSFPQWAGQLQWAPFRAGGSHTERFGRLILVYGTESDPGVEWVVARHACAVESLDLPPRDSASGKTSPGIWTSTDFQQRLFLSTTPLALHDLHHYAELPGMSVQINLFSSGGYAVAVKIAHALADAQTLMVFMHQWAAASRELHGYPHQSSLVGPPLFDPLQLDTRAAGDIDARQADPVLSAIARSLPMHRFDWWATTAPGYPSMIRPTTEASKPPIKVLSTAKLSPSTSGPWHTWDLNLPVSQAQLYFSAAELHRLRDTARSNPAGRPDTSRLDVLLAHLWTLINRARGLTDSKESVFLNITLSARQRLSPPLPDTFLGSPLFLSYIHASGSTASSRASLSFTAAAIRDMISLFTPEKMAAMLHDAAHEVCPQRLWQAFLGGRHTLVTSWMRLRVYELDFEGEGRRPRHVHAVMPKMDGCLQVMEAGGESGGVFVSLYLESGAMRRLVEDGLLREYKWE